MDRHAKHFPLRYLLQTHSAGQRIRYHCVFWLIFILFHLLYFAGPKEKVKFNTVWVISYAVYYLRFIPVYYLAVEIFSRLKEKYFGASLMIVTGILMVLIMHAANVTVFYVLVNLFGFGGLPPNFQGFADMYLQSAGDNRVEDWQMLLIYDLSEMQLLFLPLGLKMVQYGVREQMENKDLLTEKLKNDLATLRAQPAPHFILNTLNSVHAELLPVSDKAASYLVSLTDVYRFTLYETANDMISLEREWQALLHFADLEARRFEDRLRVTVKQSGQIPKDALIPTLILFTLIENAFKHGVYPTIEDCWVDIELKIQGDKLLFTVRNSKPVLHFRHDETHTSGIGLNNVKQRLDLSLKTEYSLKVQDSEHQYSIELSIALHLLSDLHRMSDSDT